MPVKNSCFCGVDCSPLKLYSVEKSTIISSQLIRLFFQTEEAGMHTINVNVQLCI
jgi:hypothetical protein